MFKSADMVSLGIAPSVWIVCEWKIIKKKNKKTNTTSESIAENKEHAFLAQISHVWGDEAVVVEKGLELVMVMLALGLIQMKSSEAFL